MGSRITALTAFFLVFSLVGSVPIAFAHTDADHRHSCWFVGDNWEISDNWEIWICTESGGGSLNFALNIALVLAFFGFVAFIVVVLIIAYKRKN